MWRTLRFEEGAWYWTDEAGVKRGDAANEDGVDTEAMTVGAGGSSVEEGDVAAEWIPKSVAEVCGE